MLRYDLAVDRPSEWPVNRDSALRNELIAGVRGLDASGAPDEEVAVWLKSRTVSFGESAVVLRAARDLGELGAFKVLRRTETWRRSEHHWVTRFRFSNGSERVAHSVSYSPCNWSVGERRIFPADADGRSYTGGRFVWRATSVEESGEPGMEAVVTLEFERPDVDSGRKEA
jgi:hypothetical protein